MCPLPALHVYEDIKPHSAAMNMAIDEALLESATAPSLRFYGWRQPSLSFGYFGRYADVSEHENEREIVRRWTGGGIVLHGADLTYSVILPTRDREPLSPSREIYAEIHEAIRVALSHEVAAALAAGDAPKVSDACFANPVAADVLVDGRKIAGAAQRRTRAGLLHQGSIQYEHLPHGFREAFASAICPSFEMRSVPPEAIERATDFAHTKYGTPEWICRR